VSAEVPALFATPATAEAIAHARAIVLLVGGYDGSGNYGDMAQLDAALDLLDALGPGILALALLEGVHAERHRELRAQAAHPLEHALFADATGEGDEALAPVAGPPGLAFAGIYLYGGGYLNPSWGDRKLALLRTAEDFARAGGVEPACRVSTGLQVNRGWIAGLGADDAKLLRGFELLGVRDRRSREALAPLESEALSLETGDDALGVFARWTPAAAAPSPDHLHVNVHVADHGWVTDEPDALLGFCTELVNELGGLAGTPVMVHPLIAYIDGGTTELPAVTRLAEACAARDIAVAEPRILRPAALGEAAPAMSRAALTVSCSYHVALTSLVLGVPAALVCDNAYYEQKAGGLREDFGEAAFTVRTGADPRESAQPLAAVLLGGDRQERAQELAMATSAVLRRRDHAESELLARLGGAALQALAARVADLDGRAGEAAELHAQLNVLRTDHQELLRESSAPGVRLDTRTALEQARAGAALERAAGAAEAGRRIASEARADDLQRQLDIILASRSWALTLPLRASIRRVRGAGGGRPPA